LLNSPRASAGLCGLWLLLVTLLTLSLWSDWRKGMLTFNSDMLALLPQEERDPALMAALNRFSEKGSDLVVLLVGQRDKQQATVAADTLANRLSDSGLFSDVNFRVATEQALAMGSAYWPYRTGLLSPAAQGQLATPVSLVQQAQSYLYSPVAVFSEETLLVDPLFLFQDFMASLSGSGPLVYDDGVLWVREGEQHFAVLLAQLHDSAFSLSLQNRLQQLLHQWQVSAGSAATLLKAGVVFHAAAGSATAQQEISTIGLGSLVGIVVLMLLVFRHISPLLLILLALSVGWLVALRITCWVFGEIHLFTLVMGASLVGVAVDYGIHYCAVASVETERALKRVLPVVGTNSTADASFRTAAATARQTATSKPFHSPFASGAAKPTSPVVTPQFSLPRALTSSSVPAAAAPAASPATVSAPINTDFFMLTSS